MSTLNFNMSKILEMFKNLKSDAMPRPPRRSEDEHQVHDNETEHPNVIIEDVDEEEIIIESEDDKKKKPRKKNSKPKKVVYDDDDDDDMLKPNKNKCDSSSSVKVQATGNVYNIVNSSKVRVGNDYYFGPVSSASKSKTKTDDYEEEIVKDNLITLLMEAKIKPEHDYLSYISKNLGKNWHAFFRVLGFKQGRIETAEINAGGYDVSEARYKLLLDWVNNDDDGTLGRLSTLLWEEGERSIVKDLSIMYKKSKK